jgi:hypothetical protein
METGIIKTFQLLKSTINQSNASKTFLDARNLLSREQIDVANTPVLFVELGSGQNGTLIPYPGRGIGQTWLGADGATITLERGVLKASRGMGDDLMGSYSSMPLWSKIENSSGPYTRKISHLSGNNKLKTRSLQCEVQKNNKRELLKIWDVQFRVIKYTENCNHNSTVITNTFYVDEKEIVRKSFQYHSETIGYIITERLDR